MRLATVDNIETIVNEYEPNDMNMSFVVNVDNEHKLINLYYIKFNSIYSICLNRHNSDYPEDVIDIINGICNSVIFKSHSGNVFKTYDDYSLVLPIGGW